MYPFGKGLARYLPMALLMIPLLLYVIFGLGPSIATIFFSLTNATGIPGVKWEFIGLENYRRFLFSSDSGERIASAWRSVQFAFSVVVIQNAIALFMAVVINKKLRGDVFYRATYFLPVVLGVTISGLIWKLMFNPIGGPVQSVLEMFGTRSNFFGSYDVAFELVIFVQIWMYMAYSMTIFLAGLQSIPKDMYEAGYIDGTTKWQSFRNITFPMIAPAFTVNMLLSIIGALQTFDIIYVLTNGAFYTRTLALDVFSTAIANNASADFGLASATAMVQFLLVLVVTVIAMIYLRRREVEM
jgi:raffinose/stachyose/melibiose transport system permease protein